MKLYKYIDFKTVNKANREVWHEPAAEGTLFFSPLSAIRSVNDDKEFKHSWETDSWFFNNYINKEIEPRYERLFNSARTLCLSRQFSEKCWLRFCPNGGVCYEFEFNETLKKSDVSSRNVLYANTKISNMPQFIIQNVSSQRIRVLLSKKSELSKAELSELNSWLNSGEPNRISMDHIVNEMTFKKLTDYEIENEYRYIHPEKPMDGKRIPLINSKLDFETLGLKLKRIFTSDLKRAKEVVGQNIKVTVPSFILDIQK